MTYPSFNKQNIKSCSPFPPYRDNSDLWNLPRNRDNLFHSFISEKVFMFTSPSLYKNRKCLRFCSISRGRGVCYLKLTLGYVCMQGNRAPCLKTQDLLKQMPLPTYMRRKRRIRKSQRWEYAPCTLSQEATASLSLWDVFVFGLCSSKHHNHLI